MRVMLSPVCHLANKIFMTNCVTFVVKENLLGYPVVKKYNTFTGSYSCNPNQPPAGFENSDEFGD